MPLVTITCHHDWYPWEDPEHDSPMQASTYTFAAGLPELFSQNAAELRMDPCPPEGVQVNFELFHGRAINAPEGIWVKVEMAEVLTKTVAVVDVLGIAHDIQVRDEEAELEVTAKLKALFREPLSQLVGQPHVAVDVFWGPDHGWLKFDDVGNTIELDW